MRNGPGGQTRSDRLALSKRYLGTARQRSPMDLFIKKLRYGATLTEADKALIRSLAQDARKVEARTDIQFQAAPTPGLPLTVDG